MLRLFPFGVMLVRGQGSGAAKGRAPPGACVYLTHRRENRQVFSAGWENGINSVLRACQVDALRRDVVLGEHVRLFPARQSGRIIEVTEELAGHLAEVRLVADPETVRDLEAKLVPNLRETHARIARLQLG